MNANEMRALADSANETKDYIDFDGAYAVVLGAIRSAAADKRYGTSISVSRLYCSDNVLNLIICRLRQDGFKVEKEKLVTAYYSAEDWDEEDLLKISWKDA